MGGNFLPNWHPKPLFVGSHKMAFVFVFAGAKITKNHKHAKGWGPHPRVQAARLLRVHLSGSCMAQATRKNETPCTFQRPHWKVICWQVAFFFLLDQFRPAKWTGTFWPKSWPMKKWRNRRGSTLRRSRGSGLEGKATLDCLARCHNRTELYGHKPPNGQVTCWSIPLSFVDP